MFQRFEYLDLKQREQEMLREADQRRRFARPERAKVSGSWSIENLRLRLSWAR